MQFPVKIVGNLQ